MGVVDTFEWACVLCGRHMQNDWTNRAMNLHHTLCKAWTFLHRKYSDDTGGHGYGQLVIGRFITTMCLLTHHVLCRGFWWNIKSPRWLSTPIAQIWHCNIWLFPKLKSPLKGKRFQIIDEIQENRKGQLMAIGRTVWGPKVPTLKGTEASLSYVHCFLYLVFSLVNVSLFL